jgi:protein tyrosine/serine phosphatase
MRVAALRLAVPFLLSAALGCTAVQPVREGALYRSGQLSTTQLESAVNEHKIKTVVNLRGKQPEAKWYLDQKRVLKELDVKQVDVPFDPSNPEAVDELIAVLREEEKPILVHSYWSNGSVGLASGIYRSAIEKQSLETAKKELAFWQRMQAPFLPESAEQKTLAQWSRRPREEDRAVVAAKRRSDGEDFGFGAFESPTDEKSQASKEPPRRWPWAPDPRKEVNAEPSLVVLGPPKVIDDRIADRAERQRY